MCHGAAMARKSRAPVKGFSRRASVVVAGEDEIDDGGAEEEDEGDESLGEDSEGQGSPHYVGVGACGGKDGACPRRSEPTSVRDYGNGLVERAEHAVERGAEEEREQDLGNEVCG